MQVDRIDSFFVDMARVGQNHGQPRSSEDGGNFLKSEKRISNFALVWFLSLKNKPTTAAAVTAQFN